MSPATVELIGGIAAALTTLAFFPQALRTIRTRETAGLSAGTYLLFSTGIAIWLVYGLLIGSWPLIVGNAVTLVPQLAILAILLGKKSAG